MKPKLEEYRNGATHWVGTHNGVQYKVSHHGISSFRPEGIWCFYVFFDERMFQREEDWAKFNLQKYTREMVPGKFWEHFPYDNLPELPWHGGPSYGDRHEHLDRNTGKHYAVIEVGCDYSHLWDEGNGFPYDLESVKRDATKLIDEFRAQFPQKEACGYCGVIGAADEFYTARNGARVHKSKLGNLRESGWVMWLPVEEPAQ